MTHFAPCTSCGAPVDEDWMPHHDDNGDVFCEECCVACAVDRLVALHEDRPAPGGVSAPPVEREGRAVEPTLPSVPPGPTTPTRRWRLWGRVS